MRTHRRFFIALLLVVLTATACSSGGSAPAGTAAEIAENIFLDAGLEPFGPTVTLETEQDIEFFLGSTNYPPFTDSAIVQPLINVDARLVEVLVVGSSDEADEVKEQLEVDIDPTRLICVSFSPEDVIIDSRDNVVFLVIDANHEERDALADAFKSID